MCLLCALTWSGEAWADDWDQWFGKSGSGTQQGGTWYVLYNADEDFVGVGVGIPTSKEFNLLGPGTNLTFEANRNMATGVGSLKIEKYVNNTYSGHTIFDQNTGEYKNWRMNYVSYGPYDVSDATKLKFSENGASYKKLFRNVKVPMAQYVIESSETSSLSTINFSVDKVDNTSTKSFTIYWCNVPAMTYTVTGTNKDDVEVSITNNSEAGKYNTATVNVKYKRGIAGNLNATLTIKDTYGNYSKAITLTGSATKYNQTLSWKNESAINTSLKVDDTQNIPATATSGLSASYSSNNTSVLTVTSSGKITAVGAGTATITVAQAGNYKYNAATSISKTFTVTKYDQTLTWANPSVMNIVNGETMSEAAKATAPGGTVTYESSNNGVATVNSNGDVTGISTGNFTITARQAGNNKYNPVEATRQFTVINKYQATFTPSGFTGTNPTIYVDATPTITLADIDTDFTYSSSEPTVVSVVRDGNVITLTALKVGTADVTLTQPNNTTHSAVSTTYHFTVEKVPNTLAVSLSATAAQVDGTINVNFPDRNNEGTAIVGTITEQSLSSSVNQTINNETPVITYVDGVITACNAGTAKITFTQAETDKYEGFTSSTYNITVTKLSNPITITLADGSATNIKLKYGNTATLSYTSANNSPTSPTPTVTRVSGSYTTLSGNTITAGNAPGTDFYEIRQAETYKYEAGLASFTIRVNNSDEVEGYVLYDEKEYSHGTGSGVMHTYSISGPCDSVLYYSIRRQLAAIYYGMYIEYSTVNNDWTQIDYYQDIETSYKDVSNDKLPESARYVRFRFPGGGDLTKYIKNVKVYRKTFVRESHDKNALGTVLIGNTATATITVSYSSTNGGNINISSSKPQRFVPSISQIAVESNKKATSPGGTEYTCGVDGTQTFTVTYIPDPNLLGEESATITIGDLFHTQTITLTATAAKRANTLAVIGEQTLKVDDVVDVYSSKNSSAELSYSFSRNGVATYNPATNKLTAIGAGTTTLTLTQLENDSHYGITKTVEINVSKYDQAISWNNELTSDDRTLDVGDVLSTNTATASSGLTVTYSSNNADALEVNATTGELIAKAGGSNIAITATQAGNYKYNEASITRYFTVIQKEYAVVTTTLSESVTNIFPIGNPDITIRCNATLTTNALSITGDAGVVTSTFASNTFTLTAVNEGTVTVTLTRAEDEGYYAVSKTYSIQVIKPALALNPAATPLIDYEEYSSITLNRTLKAGYSTIALPFDTDVSELVAGRNEAYDSSADWVAQLSAVTSSVADGYTLYFQKVAGGVIRANEPYVLHLGYQVVNPSWTDLDDGISVEEAEADSLAPSAGYSGYTDWAMWSNFTPSFAMSGKYGIVNSEGGLKLGGNGSTLNAFTAYIAGPALPNHAPRLRVAYVDEDGTATFIDGLPEDDGVQEETVAVYGPDGQRRNRMQRGVNIVRFADGTTRKVQY